MTRALHALRATSESEILDGFDDACCMGAAIHGPIGCTCWEPVFSDEQLPVVDHLDIPRRLKCCHDCAFRNGSPERQEDDGAMDAILASGRRFFCHQGMRRVVEEVHPDGRRRPADPGDYRPPTDADRDIAFKADGTPAEICAGWLAQRAHVEKLKPTLVGADVGLPGGCVDVSSGESGGAMAVESTAAASPDHKDKRPPETAPSCSTNREKGVSGVPLPLGAVSGGRPDKHDERTAA